MRLRMAMVMILSLIMTIKNEKYDIQNFLVLFILNYLLFTIMDKIWNFIFRQ
jgi:hypothetical protein